MHDGSTNYDRFGKVQSGMLRAEVHALMGPPSERRSGVEGKRKVVVKGNVVDDADLWYRDEATYAVWYDSSGKALDSACDWRGSKSFLQRVGDWLSGLFSKRTP